MIYREHRDKFVNKNTGFEIDNPEVITRVGFSYYFLIYNEETMNDEEYVQAIIKQAFIEDINFIILFENTEILKTEFTNLLISSLLTDNNNFRLLLSFYNEKTDRYEYFNVTRTKEGKIKCLNSLL